jgi:hypothetical protein
LYLLLFVVLITPFVILLLVLCFFCIVFYFVCSVFLYFLLLMYTVVYFLFVYKCTHHCHRMETQLQLINIIYRDM